MTVAIPTRNRPDMLERAVRAALEACPAATVLVVDQSEGEPSEAVRSLAEAGRIVYHRDHGVGLARARNVALVLARDEFVLSTDDDCELQPGAIEHLVEALTQAPDVAVAFGTVRGAWETGLEGFIPQFLPDAPRVLRGRLAERHDHGIGACLAMRREAALRIGGFDEAIGPGTSLGACEDGEFAYRALRAGYAVAHVPDAVVVHYGFRAASEGAHYAFETYRGIGGAFARHLRAGDLGAGVVLAHHLGIIAREMVRQSVRYRRPGGLSRLRGFVSGIATGLRG